MSRTRLHAGVLLLSLMLGACVPPFFQTDQTPTDKLATVIALNTGLAGRTAEQLRTDEITVKQGEERIAILKNIEASTKVGAAALDDERPQDAGALLRVVEVALLELQKIVGEAP